MTKKRDKKGQFTSDDGGDSPAREPESLTVHGNEEAKEGFIESLDRPGLTEDEGGGQIEELLKAAEQTEAEPPEGVDPELVEEARQQLEESGSIEDAARALEQNLQAEDVVEHEEAQAPSDAVPFSELAEELDLSPDAVTVTAKVDGEEQEIPLSEALNGYQRQKDYTRKTQEVAEQRRELEQTQEQYAQQLEMLAVTIGNQLAPEQQQALVSEYNRVVGEIYGQAEEAMAETVQEGRERLRETFGWRDEESWNEARSRLRDYAVEEYGYTEQELNAVRDPRVFEILEKARRVDEATGAVGVDLKERRGEASKTLRPGSKNPGTSRRSRRQQGASEAKQRVRRTGRLRDGAKAIEGILAAEEG